MMFIPIDDEKEKVSKGVQKVRREQDNRLAKKKVREAIEGWQKVFEGTTGRPYFKVGEIKREKDWLEKIPSRGLCKSAEESRPKREDIKS